MPYGSSDRPASIVQVVVDPRDANTVFARTENGLVYKTINGGAQWVPMDQGFESVNVLSLVLDPARSYRLYAVASQQLYFLDDGAQTWQVLKARPLPVGMIAPNPANSELLVYGSSGLYVGLEERGTSVLPVVIRSMN